jgi:AAA domain
MRRPILSILEGDPENADGSALTVRAANLELAQPPRWAWENRIVLGYLNLLIGNEGVGKGTLVAWLIARLTHGDLPGHLRGEPVSVGVLGDEDSFDDVWTPRLYAAGAELSRVVQIERPDGFVNITEDREQLGDAVKTHGIRVLFLDQLLDNLGAGTDDWRQKSVRLALQPLRALARALDVAAIGCLHPNKKADSFRQLVAGSSAFNAVSRSSLLLAEHPEDEQRRVLIRGKGNLSQKPDPVEFEITSYRFEANGYTFKGPLAASFTTSDLDIDQLLGDENKRSEHSNIANAAEIIEALLKRDGKWHPAKPIYEACANEHVDERTLQRAKARLKIEHRRMRTFQAPAEWRWPTTDDTQSTRVFDVASVATVASANGQKPIGSSTDDTHDTHERENTSPDSVSSGHKAQNTPPCVCATHSQPDNTGQCQRCHGQATHPMNTTLKANPPNNTTTLTATPSPAPRARYPKGMSVERGGEGS